MVLGRGLCQDFMHASFLTALSASAPLTLCHEPGRGSAGAPGPGWEFFGPGSCPLLLCLAWDRSHRVFHMRRTSAGGLRSKSIFSPSHDNRSWLNGLWGLSCILFALTQLTQVELRESHHDGHALTQQTWPLIGRCAQQVQSPPATTAPFPPDVSPK